LWYVAKGSLRFEIGVAQDGDTIKFSPKLAGATIKLKSEIAIDVGLDIEGLGAGKLSVSGNNASRIFNIGPDASAVTIAGLTLKNGKSGQGSAVLDDGASLTLKLDTLSNNQAVLAVPGITNEGGALMVFGESTVGMTVTITNCRFVNDTAIGGAGGSGEGGAIAVDAETSAGLVLTVWGSSFTSDSATGGAGGTVPPPA